LFLSGLVVTAAGSAAASPLLWASALAALGGSLFLFGVRRSARMTPLAWSLCAFAAWMVANDFLNSPYTAAGIFNPAFLLCGFVLARSAVPRAGTRARAVLLAGVAALALWALWQSASGEGRAHANFETPNTLATIINLALAPLLFWSLYGQPRRAQLGLALLLTAALTCTLSRGGAMALVGAIFATALLYRRAPSRHAVARLLVVLAGGVVAGAIALQLPEWRSREPDRPGELQSVGSTFASTLSARGELYELAASALAERPWLGSGYLSFNSLLERKRAQVPSYASVNVTYFVHNDYLQTLLELGVPGLAALLALIALPFCLAAKRAARDNDRLPLYAALAGVATMAIHALGDFPFYVPLCLLLFGGLLGEMDRLLAPEPSAPPEKNAGATRWRVIGAAAVLTVLIVPPPLAEAAALYGERNWRVGKGESAALGFEAARRLQPRDWRYHWYAAQFWMLQAAQGGNRTAAKLADGAFEAAIDANPRDPRPLLGRLAMQLRLGTLLDNPQSPATLRAWAERAFALAPLNPAVRQDYAAAMSRLGNPR
jgi:O-antigen ligase